MIFTYPHVKIWSYFAFFFNILLKHYVLGTDSFKLQNNPVWGMLPTTYRWAKREQRHVTTHPRSHLVNAKPGSGPRYLALELISSPTSLLTPFLSLTRDGSLRKDSKPRKRIWKQKWNDQRKGLFPPEYKGRGKREEETLWGAVLVYLVIQRGWERPMK